MRGISIWKSLAAALLLESGVSAISYPRFTPSLQRSKLSTALPSPPRPFPSTEFHQKITYINGGGRPPKVTYTKVDWGAMAKYSLGLAGQMALIFGFLKGVDAVVARLALKIPFALNFFFLYAFNIKSSIFSLFPNKVSEWRKVQQRNWEYNKRKRPTWTPPGFAFVFGWPLLTFGLRAYTGAMVVRASAGQYATKAIMSLMVHLGCANLWNTASNVEKRLGTSVLFLYDMWITKAFAAYQFYQVDPLAGKLLALSLTWISAACALGTRTWQINPDPDTGKLEPLIPMQHGKWSTKYRWEQNDQHTVNLVS